MPTRNFVVQNGLTVGPLTIDAATGSITTSGNVNITGNLGVTQIARNDSSISLNDTGGFSNVLITVDGSLKANVNPLGFDITNGNIRMNNNWLIGTGGINSTGNILGAVGSFGSINSTGFFNTSGNISGAVVNTGALNATGTTTLVAVNSTGFINTTANVSGAVVNTGALNATGTTTLVAVNSTGFINTTANVSGAVVNTGALNATGTSTVAAINSSGFINTTANVSGAVVNAGALTSTGNITVTNAWLNAGTINVVGNVSAAAGMIGRLGVGATPSGVVGQLVLTGNIIAGLAQFAAINATPIGNISASTGAFTSITGSGYINNSANVSASQGMIGSLGVGTTASGTTGEIRATNNITAYFSDQRLKENITVIPNALDKLDRISGVTYISNDLAATFGYTDKTEQVGVLAQELKQVLPHVVKLAPFDTEYVNGVETSKSGENYMTVQYERIIPLLVQAIKELKAEVDQLKSKE